MLQRYKEKGLKICAWINPYIAQGTDFFREGLEKGYLLKRADGMGIKQDMICKIVVSAISLVLNYICSKLFIFKKKESSK